jgi:hypothetical protein
VKRGADRSPELRQLELFGEDRRTVRVEVRLTPFETFRLDAIAQLRRVSRAEAVREAIGWLAARETQRVERARQAQIENLWRQGNEWDPVAEHLADADGGSSTDVDVRVDGRV